MGANKHLIATNLGKSKLLIMLSEPILGIIVATGMVATAVVSFNVSQMLTEKKKKVVRFIKDSNIDCFYIYDGRTFYWTGHVHDD